MLKCLFILCLTWVLAHWWIIPLIRSERFRAERDTARSAYETEHNRARKYEAAYFSTTK